MNYKIIKREEQGCFEKRYVVINKNTKKLIDDCHGYGFLSPENAMKHMRKQISAGYKDISENDIEVVVSDKLSGNRCKTDFDFGNANDKQIEAITTTDGPLLIIAGPGTGKTFTLVKRIVYIIKEKGVKPEEIFVATFTNKAANELITRVTNELLTMGISVNVKDMYIGTIHSICLRLLDEYIEYTDIDRHYSQIDETAQTYMMSCAWNWKQFVNIENFNRYFNKANVSSLVKLINKLEEECVDIDAMIKSNQPYEVCLGNVILVHKEILKEKNKITFTRMQTELLQLFKNHPEILKKVRSKIKYFLVDEYQDTNHLQEKILLMLAGENNNICVVGDDDQGLYRFRGASVGNIINFKNNFPDGKCREVMLNINYRSNNGIIDFYNQWMNLDSFIKWNNCRLDKKIEPFYSANNSASVTKCIGNNIADWENKLCDLIIRLKESGKITDYNQIAFLSKSVSSDKIKNLMKAFEKRGIPIYAPRANNFFSRDEVKQLLGCLLLAFSEYLDHIYNTYFKKDCIHAANECINKYPDTLGEWIKKMKSAKNNSLLKTGKSILDITYELLEFEPFRSYFDVTQDDGVIAERKIRNISQILNLISQYENLSSVGSTLLTEKNINNKGNTD